MKQTYDVVDVDGRPIYRGLTLGSDGIYGWDTGGYIDPLDMERQGWTIKVHDMGRHFFREDVDGRCLICGLPGGWH